MDFTNTCKVEHQVSGNLVFTASMKYGEYRYFLHCIPAFSFLILQTCPSFLTLQTCPMEILSHLSSWLLIQSHEQTPLVNTHSEASQQHHVIHRNSVSQEAVSNSKRSSITAGMPLKAVPAYIYIISKRYTSISEMLPTLIAWKTFIAFIFLLGRLL